MELDSNIRKQLNSSFDLTERVNVTCAAALLLPVNFSLLRVSWQAAQLFSVEEELALKEARWLQLEAGLQSTVASLEHELELEREQHSTEVTVTCWLPQRGSA